MPKCGACVYYLNPEECPRAEYKDRQQNIMANPSNAKACELFRSRRLSRLRRESRAKNKTWKLDLEAKPKPELKPFGFYDKEGLLIEGAWLPYRSEENTEEIKLRPSLIIKKQNGEVSIQDFLSSELKIQKAFPSNDLKTLISAEATKMILDNTEIDPKQVDKEIDITIQKHCHIGQTRKTILKRWIEGTYFHDIFGTFPILNVVGASESGKTRLLLVVASLSYHGETAVNPTQATLFRTKEEDRATLCFDEIEFLNVPNIGQTLRCLINASYSSGFSVYRYDESEGKRIRRAFDLYSPLVLSGIKGLEGVTESRSIRLIMERTERDYPKARAEDYKELRDKLYVLRFALAFELKRIYDQINISNIVSARFEELFKPLFTLTRVFGTQEEYEDLSQWARMYQETFRIEALNVTEEEQILIALANLEPISESWYSLKELTDMVNMIHSRSLSSRYVSQILNRVGITQRRKVEGLTQFCVTRKALETVAKRLGIDLPKPKKVKPEQEAIDVFCLLNYISSFLRYKVYEVY